MKQNNPTELVAFPKFRIEVKSGLADPFSWFAIFSNIPYRALLERWGEESGEGPPFRGSVQPRLSGRPQRHLAMGWRCARPLDIRERH